MTHKSSIVRIFGREFSVAVVGPGIVEIDGQEYPYELEHLENGNGILRLGGRTMSVLCREKSSTDYDIWIQRHAFSTQIQDPRAQLLRRLKGIASSESGPIVVRAPMPGLVSAIEVSVGDSVDSGQGLVILEAMKMENELRSPVRGRIRSVDVRHRAPVEKGQILLVIEAHPESPGNS